MRWRQCIYASGNWVIFGPGNVLLPMWCQTIIWTNNDSATLDVLSRPQCVKTYNGGKHLYMSATICDCYNCTALVKAMFSVSDVKVLWSNLGPSSWGLPAGLLRHKVLPPRTSWKMGRLLLHSFLVFNWHSLNNTHDDKVSYMYNTQIPIACPWDVGCFFLELEAMICVPAQKYVDNILLEFTVFEWNSAVSIKSYIRVNSVSLSISPSDCLYVWT